MNNEWFECKVKYERTLDDGKVKKVTEPYLVDALSFTEAEKDLYIIKCKELGLNCKKLKDTRYISFDAISSRKIDNLILKTYGFSLRGSFCFAL